MLQRIAPIYRIDSGVRRRTREERVLVRQQGIAPLLTELRVYVAQRQRRYSPRAT